MNIRHETWVQLAKNHIAYGWPLEKVSEWLQWRHGIPSNEITVIIWKATAELPEQMPCGLCAWKIDANGNWVSGCDRTIEIRGGPRYHDFAFCPYCGLILTIEYEETAAHPEATD